MRQLKERPILFSAPMVRAILDGDKTQTRRVIKPQPFMLPEVDSEAGFAHTYNGDEIAGTVKIPYGKVGDRLWVRESFSVIGFSEGWEESTESGYDFEPSFCRIKYPADGSNGSERLIEDLVYENDFGVEEIAQARRASKKKSVPSIHMPRWASRINLKITGVRVERLNDISEEDAIAEGCDHSKSSAAIEVGWYEKPVSAYRRLWEQINGKGSWDLNPWVWVIEFKQIKNQEVQP